LGQSFTPSYFAIAVVIKVKGKVNVVHVDIGSQYEGLLI
jgi:hypothetical protein